MQLLILSVIFTDLGFRTHDVCTIFGMEKHPEESHSSSALMMATNKPDFVAGRPFFGESAT